MTKKNVIPLKITLNIFFIPLEVPSLQFQAVSARALQWWLCQGYKISQKSWACIWTAHNTQESTRKLPHWMHRKYRLPY